MKPQVFLYSLLLAHLLGQLQPANDNGRAVPRVVPPNGGPTRPRRHRRSSITTASGRTTRPTPPSEEGLRPP